MTTWSTAWEATARTVDCPMSKCRAKAGECCINTQSDGHIWARTPKRFAHTPRHKRALSLKAAVQS